MNEYQRRTRNTSNVGLHRRKKEEWNLTKRGERVLVALFLLMIIGALWFCGAVEAGLLD